MRSKAKLSHPSSVNSAKRRGDAAERERRRHPTPRAWWSACADALSPLKITCARASADAGRSRAPCAFEIVLARRPAFSSYDSTSGGRVPVFQITCLFPRSTKQKKNVWEDARRRSRPRSVTRHRAAAVRMWAPRDTSTGTSEASSPRRAARGVADTETDLLGSVVAMPRSDYLEILDEAEALEKSGTPVWDLEAECARLGLVLDEVPMDERGFDRVLKVAYRKAALRAHPDKHPPERRAAAEAEFKKVAELTEGYSGRAISKLMISLQATNYLQTPWRARPCAPRSMGARFAAERTTPRARASSQESTSPLAALRWPPPSLPPAGLCLG